MWNFYLPPKWSVNCSAAMIDVLGQAAQDSFGGGDMNWAGTSAVQRLPQGSQRCDEVNEAGKTYLRKMDDQIWRAWTKASRTLGAKASWRWSTTTSWSSEARRRCDYLWASTCIHMATITSRPTNASARTTSPVWRGSAFLERRGHAAGVGGGRHDARADWLGWGGAKRRTIRRTMS